MYPDLKILLIKFVIISIPFSPMPCRSSSEMLSLPQAFPFGRFLITDLISSLLIVASPGQLRFDPEKLQHKVFWYQNLDKNELNNISKIHRNPLGKTQVSAILRGSNAVIFPYTN